MVVPWALYPACCEWARVKLRRHIAAKSLFSSHFSNVISIQSLRNPFKPLQETFTSKNKCIFPTAISTYLKMKPITQWLSLLKSSLFENLGGYSLFKLTLTLYILVFLHATPTNHFSFMKLSFLTLTDTMAASSLSCIDRVGICWLRCYN